MPVTDSALDDFVVRHAAAGHWPGGVYAVGPPGAVPQRIAAAGRLAVEPFEEPARVDAFYDLASLTKPLATALVAARLAERGALDLDAPLAPWLPEAEGYAGATPSAADLLLHRSGLPAWTALYRQAAEPADVARVITSLAPVARAGERAVYSCPGPILLGLALERAFGAPLAALFRHELETCAALAAARDAVQPGPVAAELAAPTETGRAYEQRLAGDGPRGRAIAPGPPVVLRGTVHDGNAAFLGGFAGNAGLFGTAAGVFALASALAAPGLALGERTWRRVAEPDGPHGDDVRTLGFQSGRTPNAPAGALGARSFGHVGFTGTSVWIDPDRPLVAVLLTNRVHPRWQDATMQTWRREFHDLAAGGTP